MLTQQKAEHPLRVESAEDEVGEQISKDVLL